MNEEQMQKLIEVIDNMIEKVLSYESEEKKNELKDKVLDETLEMFHESKIKEVK